MWRVIVLAEIRYSSAVAMDPARRTIENSIRTCARRINSSVRSAHDNLQNSSQANCSIAEDA